jgi:hypothetical protein
MCVYMRSALALFAVAIVGSVALGTCAPAWARCAPDDEECESLQPEFRSPAPSLRRYRYRAPTASPAGTVGGNPSVSYGDALARGRAIEEATSVFVAPHDYPPRDYGAYGIVAFPSAPTPGTRPRFIKVCEAYVATLPPATDSEVPFDQQMVTVWPVSTSELAQELSGLTELLDRNAGCEQAVDHYHFRSALTALRQSGSRRSGNGPFLLGWSPASTKGKKDALVLVADLSNLETDEEFLARFQQWRDDIETNPEIFKDQWTVDRLRTAIRDWADRWGNIFLSSGES